MVSYKLLKVHVYLDKIVFKFNICVRYDMAYQDTMYWNKPNITELLTSLNLFPKVPTDNKSVFLALTRNQIVKQTDDDAI